MAAPLPPPSLLIEPISVASPQFAGAKVLWRKNSSTLGFFPEGAFVEFASGGRLLGICQHGAFAGYVAFRISGDRGVIVHLCITESARGTGAARALVNELKRLTRSRDLRGIGLSCRADFAATSFWPKMGFSPVHERAGRSKDGHLLTYWWFDHGLPDLFSLSATAGDQVRVCAAIDANIYYDLISDRLQGEESRALTADWLQSELELCITDEIYQEINRCKEESERRRCRERLSLCRMLISPEKQQIIPRRRVLELLAEGKTPDDKSDRAHLSKAAAGKAQVFLTRDDGVLERAEEIRELLDLEVMHPATLISRIDELRRAAAYEPARLAGSHIALRRARSEDIEQLPELFCPSHGSERLAELRQSLRELVAYPDHQDAFVVTDGSEIIALLACDRRVTGAVSIPLLRVLPGPLCQTLNRHLAGC